MSRNAKPDAGRLARGTWMGEVHCLGNFRPDRCQSHRCRQVTETTEKHTTTMTGLGGNKPSGPLFSAHSVNFCSTASALVQHLFVNRFQLPADFVPGGRLGRMIAWGKFLTPFNWRTTDTLIDDATPPAWFAADVYQIHCQEKRSPHQNAREATRLWHVAA
jgi:hypothetical protein